MADQILSVLAEILTDVPGRITSSAFIGRQVELESLLEVFESTLDGPAVVLLGGEAGIGKTRLVSEFAGHLPEARFLVGACLEWVKQSCRICHLRASCDS